MQIAAVIPTYNRRTQVMHAIDSALAQTLPPDEIVVVDDGSTDGTMAALDARYGSRIHAVKQQNAGPAAARNRGVRVAKSEWIAFLDSDDIWLPAKLERQAAALSSFGDSFGACFTNYAFHDADRLPSAFDFSDFRGESEFNAIPNPTIYLLAEYWNRMCSFVLPTLMVRRSLIDQVGGFDDTLRLAEDRDFFFRLCLATCFCVVSAELIVIDRGPGVPRLTAQIAHKSEQAYKWLDHALTKMLAMTSAVNVGSRTSLENELVALHYGGAAERISGLRLAAAAGHMSKIHALGQGYGQILSTLLMRANRKLGRAAGRRTPAT